MILRRIRPAVIGMRLVNLLTCLLSRYQRQRLAIQNSYKLPKYPRTPERFLSCSDPTFYQINFIYLLWTRMHLGTYTYNCIHAHNDCI